VLNRPGGALALHSAYDKHHLVPFGEDLPFRAFLSSLGIASLVAYGSDITPGPAPGLLDVPGAGFADPRVCYEIIFPGYNPVARGQAGWIVNVSVDAWYGDGLGPQQHFAQARWRAIETGLPLVRAASGGWSAIVDPYGRVVAQHSEGAGYAVARLPSPLDPSVYSLLAVSPGLVVCLLLALAGLLMPLRRT
jgi:apolipoprotein N-acyltransferase